MYELCAAKRIPLCFLRKNTLFGFSNKKNAKTYVKKEYDKTQRKIVAYPGVFGKVNYAKKMYFDKNTIVFSSQLPF